MPNTLPEVLAIVMICYSYYNTLPIGKVEEFRQELNEDIRKDPRHSKKRSVLKKIVANMTMGNDMSALFPDVVSCMQIGDIEIKKMVYLYLVNYAKLKVSNVIYNVNVFIAISLSL